MISNESGLAMGRIFAYIAFSHTGRSNTYTKIVHYMSSKKAISLPPTYYAAIAKVFPVRVGKFCDFFSLSFLILIMLWGERLWRERKIIYGNKR